jgi:hypothetical protein
MVWIFSCSHTPTVLPSFIPVQNTRQNSWSVSNATLWQLSRLFF